jgi:hypothetical protein
MIKIQRVVANLTSQILILENNAVLVKIEELNNIKNSYNYLDSVGHLTSQILITNHVLPQLLTK